MRRAAVVLTALALAGCVDDVPWMRGGRMTAMRIPEGDEAAEAGCLVDGMGRGSNLASLFALSYSVSAASAESFDADLRGFVPLVVLARATGEGPLGSGPVHVDIVSGAQDDDATFVFPAALPDARTSFDAELEAGGWFEARADDVALPVPVLDDLSVTGRASAGAVAGQLTIDDAGLTMTDGIFTGYLRADEVTRVTRFLRAQCDDPEHPPSICAVAGETMTSKVEEDVSVGFVVSYMGGFDVALDESGASASCVDDTSACNAIGVCALASLAPVTFVER
jgi:hypothetical protein